MIRNGSFVRLRRYLFIFLVDNCYTTTPAVGLAEVVNGRSSGLQGILLATVFPNWIFQEFPTRRGTFLGQAQLALQALAAMAPPPPPTRPQIPLDVFGCYMGDAMQLLVIRI